VSKSSTRTDSARSSLALLAQVAGLLGTGWLVWSASLVPRLDRQPLAFVIAEALEYALMAWAWSAAITFLLFLMVPKSNRSEAAAIALRTASTAVWFGPATILLSMFSPATLAAALILVVNATRLLSVHWRPIYSQRNLRRPFLHSLGVSACIEAGAVFLLMDYPLAGAALFVLSAALLTLLAIVTGATEIQRTDKLPRSVLGALLTVILAAGLTVGGLTGTVKHRTRWDHASEPRPGILQSARELLHALLYGEPAPDSASPDDRLAKKLTRPERDSSEISDDSFPGVVLWPEVKPNTILVAPLPVMRRAALGLPAADPLSIPFAGEYWMFKPPMARPPLNSYFRRASPAVLSFRTTDHRALMMEARHKLDRPIDPRCCGAIQIVIANADYYPGTVSLELVLKDSAHQALWSLGRAPVTSLPESSETLTYTIPARAALGSFDEFIVRFHRDALRIDRSARIALDRFVLTPRGD